ncbi:hypothetical protein J5N97_003883 [Dioscorea zingiberensis]|uniref:O-fucosyltransferase family protein n=1 Tax=Dioscorea zingiberensis TaxID=325984 RepID=A0A9D5D6Y1_9LILI|nr:hypothetical protein J5N97_003883 [Dioscorea zingiberensis]
MAENLRQRGDRGSLHRSSYDDPNPDDRDHGGSHRRWSNLFRSKRHHVTAGYIFFLVGLCIILPLLYHNFKSMICNAVAVARLLNATLILPVLVQDLVWKDETALHLRYEKGMIGLSFCDFVGTREEKEMMDAYRKKLWPRRYNNGSHLWKLALEKRKSGKCPLEPGEIAMLLRALGYESNTQIYIASGPIYGGDNKLAPLRNMFPNQVRKEELVAKGELDSLKKHVTNLAALDFLVCLKSDVFVSTHGGNFAKLITGARRTVLTRDQTPTPTRREARMMDGLRSISKDGVEHRQEKAQCQLRGSYSTVTFTAELPDLERGGGVRNVLNA